MGSIYVHWSGSCPERLRRLVLVDELRELAEMSDARLNAPQLERPAILEHTVAHRTAASGSTPNIRLHDGKLTGRILMSPLILPEPAQFLQEARAPGRDLVWVDPGGADKQEFGCISLSESHAEAFIPMDELQVHGIDFRLFDPRGLYPGADRISFVFLQCPELPAFDGRLVQLENGKALELYESDAIRQADWLVTTPSIHLRYYLEGWMDFLLTWVKYFYLPDLWYSRYEPMSGYGMLSAQLDTQVQERGKEYICRQLLDFLKLNFRDQADEWATKMVGWSQPG